MQQDLSQGMMLCPIKGLIREKHLILGQQLLQDGINHVDFSITGQGYSNGIKSSSEMTFNSRTSVFEYWVPILANEFTSNGPVQIEATVYGNDGETRNLGKLNHNVNATGNLMQPIAYVEIMMLPVLSMTQNIRLQQWMLLVLLCKLLMVIWADLRSNLVQVRLVLMDYMTMQRMVLY